MILFEKHPKWNKKINKIVLIYKLTHHNKIVYGTKFGSKPAETQIF